MYNKHPKPIKFAIIVDPILYQANYCDGICPTTPGGKLMTPLLFHFISRLQNNPLVLLTPCCAGQIYEDLSVLLNLDGMLVSATLEDVTVLCRCG